MKATFWDKRSKKYDESIKKDGLIYKKTMNSISSQLSNKDVVLDFACATGEISFDIAPYVKQIHGIDLSVKMIELANQKAHNRQVDNVTFTQTDVFDQTLESNSYSAIIAFNIFYLVDDIPKVLARLNDLLSIGGLLISKTPCLGEWNLIIQSLINLAQKFGWAPKIQSLKFVELETLVAKNNFDIIENKIWDAKNSTQWIAARKI